MRGSHKIGGGDVAKARITNHILRIMTPISPMAKSMDVMAIRRERQRLPKDVVATYAVGVMAVKGGLS